MPATFQAPHGAAAFLYPDPPPLPGALERSRKISPKSVRFRKCKFFTSSTPITYNFDLSKQSDFLRAFYFFTPNQQSLVTESHATRPMKSVESYPFSLGEKVRMRDKPVHSLAPEPSSQQTYKYYTKRDKTGRFNTFTKTDHAVPTTYNDTLCSRPIFPESSPRRNSTTPN
jgi:hypothetical protein